MIYSRCMKNPGFLIFVNKITKVRFIIKSLTKKNQELFNLSLCLYKINSPNNFSILMNDENYMSSPWGYYSK